MKINKQFKKTKKLLMLSVSCLTLLGCSTTVPLTMKFPEAPASLLQKAPDLAPLNNKDKDLSDLISNANDNYGKYHELVTRYNAWQEWYYEQKEIYEEVK